MKKIIIAFVIVLGIGALVYYLNFRQQPVQVESERKLQITKISDETAIDPMVAYDNKSVWFFNSSGHLFSVNSDGSNTSEYPIPAFPNGKIIKVLWPVQGPDFILISRNVDKTIKTYFNSSLKRYFTHQSNVQWLEWLPDGKRVVYIWLSDDKKSQQLIMADADGNGYKKIADVFWPDLALKASPDGQTVLMYRSETAGTTNKIYAANLETGQIKTIIDEGNNTDARWISPTKFLYSQSGKILLYDISLSQTFDLNINSTVQKIGVDTLGNTLYAAIPNQGQGDKFLKIDLKSGQTETYFEPNSQIIVKSVMLVGNTVYFVDNKDSKLYMISK